ncbi:MAG: hypothetical protein AB7E30_10050 [Lawsonibacter sp.]
MADSMQQNLKYTLDTGAIERVAPSKDAVRLCKNLSKGKVSADAAMATLKLKYGLVGREKRG